MLPLQRAMVSEQSFGAAGVAGAGGGFDGDAQALGRLLAQPPKFVALIRHIPPAARRLPPRRHLHCQL